MQEPAFHPAGDGHDLPGHVPRQLVRREHDHLPRHVLRLRHLAQRHLRVTRRTRSGSVSVVRVIGDSVQPGQTTFTRPTGAARTISFFRLSSSPCVIADFAAA